MSAIYRINIVSPVLFSSLRCSAMAKRKDVLAELPPPRAGHLQRLRWAAAAEAADRDVGPSHLAKYLLDAWAWGRMPATEVQRVAFHAVADGVDHIEVRKLASIGASGAQPNNCHRDLVANLVDLHISSILHRFAVVYMVPGQLLKAINMSHTVLLPHHLFATIYEKYPSAFKHHILGGDVANVGRFWRAMSEHPSMVNHPMHEKRDRTFSKAIPISLHGDGVSVSGRGRSWSRSVDVYSWQSMLASGETLCTNFLIYILYAQLISKESLNRFWKVLTWSLYWLFIGRWPRRDVDGNEWPAGSADHERAGKHLAEGFYGVVFTIRGDLEHMAKGFGMPWPHAASPCALCKGNSSDTPWTDPAPCALWRATTWDNMTWQANHPHGHPMFTQVPGVGITSFVPDVMHVFHLGIYQYLFGSVLKYLVYEAMVGSRNHNLQQLWGMIQDGYKAQCVDEGLCKFSQSHRYVVFAPHHCVNHHQHVQVFQTKYKYNELSMSMFVGTDFPKLKGKAAEIRGLTYPLCKIVETLLGDSQLHRWMKKVMLAATQIEQILHRHKDDVKLPVAVATEFRCACDALVTINTALGKHFHERGELYFHHTIKFHYAQHIGSISMYMNPRIAWCYSGEDLMQRVRLIVESCFHGTKQALVPPKVLQKYARGLSLKLGGTAVFR